MTPGRPARRPPRPGRPRPERPAARTAELLAPGSRGLTLGLLLTISLVAVESLAVGTVLPIVARDLGGLELYGWVQAAFFLGSLVGIVVSGGMLDRLPLWRTFAAGCGLFGAGLALGGLAPSMAALVAARLLQGLGGGAVGPLAYVAIGRHLPARLQPRMFALLSTAWVLPGVGGPSLAAVIGEVAGWRTVFLGLLPFLAVAGLVALGALRRLDDGARAPAVAGGGRGAVLGGGRRLRDAGLAAIGAGLVVAALGSAALLPLVAGIAAGAALLVPALRRLTPPGTLRALPGMQAAILLRGCMTFAFFAADAYVPLHLQTWRGTPVLLTGVVFTSTTLAWAAGAWLQARLVETWSPRRLLEAGFACILAGVALAVPALDRAVPPETLILSWALPGLGMGIMYATVTLVVLDASDPAEQGRATSALQLTDILGTALGIGIAGAAIAVGTRSGPDGLGAGLVAAYLLAALAAVVGLLGSRRVVRPRPGAAGTRPLEPGGAALD